jgi:5-methylcytosine-specific restriction endonuclease McrA
MARKRDLPSTLTMEQWDTIKYAFDNKCCYCGQEKPLEQEHFIPLSKGGEYAHNNIVPACRSCNARKFNTPFEIWFPKQEFYSKKREQRILKFLNYKSDTQQLSLSI